MKSAVSRKIVARSFFSVFRTASLGGLAITFLTIWLIVGATGAIDSVRAKEREAITATRIASIALESTTSIFDIRRLITKLGANRVIKEVYLVEAESFSVVASSRYDNEKVIPENLKEKAREYREIGRFSNSWIETFRSQEVVAVEEIIVESFSDRELPSGRYLLMVKFVATIFDQHLLILFAIYTTSLVCALGLLLFIQKIIFAKLFLNSFHSFVKKLKSWDEKGLEGLEDFTGEGEIIDLKDSFMAQYKKLEIERSKSIHIGRLASLGEMSAGIAHEINNPLAIITGSADLLSKFSDNPEKLASKVALIKKSCDRISRIVRGLKKFSHSGDKGNIQNHGLCNILREAIIITEAKSKRHSVPIALDLKSYPVVSCDDVEMEQVLVNLIVNAIDAVKTRPEKWIKVTLFNEDQSVVLRVTDSGPGIPENVRNKIFQPFFTTKKIGEGTGLGLSITKGILDEHKATITVVADSPNTCFEIRLPPA